MTGERLSSSFRDSSGYVVLKEGSIYRYVNEVYKEHFDLLLSSGLSQELVKSGLLVAYEDVSAEFGESSC